ncbi:hypothetical protein L596_023288 [Steinernema carpocapsae]|nr:hypothetical protein L596_023288 [Steinernema carpocapsae]
MSWFDDEWEVEVGQNYRGYRKASLYRDYKYYEAKFNYDDFRRARLRYLKRANAVSPKMYAPFPRKEVDDGPRGFNFDAFDSDAKLLKFILLRSTPTKDGKFIIDVDLSELKKKYGCD